ncbi:MAG: cobalamin-dependent protein [Desulfobacterales bacterium]
MRTLLIYPYFIDPRIDAEDIRFAPMGIYHVAAALKQHGHEVEVLNWHDRSRAEAAVERDLRAWRPQVVGFSILHANRWGAIEIARVAKRIDPGVTVVFGGVGATFLWEHLLRHFPEIDYVVLGEGERTFPLLLAALEADAGSGMGAIPGMALRRSGLPVKTAAAEPICDLDELPMPAREFDLPHLSLTRGCVSNCRFCGSPAFWGRRVRSHSAAYFVEQLAVLRARGRRFAYVSDDTFTLNRRRVLEVCRALVDRRLGMNWAAISRVDAVDEEVLGWMRRAGCIQISYGVESGSPEIRRRLNKTIRSTQVRRAFDLTQRYGIMARAYFIYGCPGETRETIQASIDLMREIKPLACVFYILDLFPGTALYESVKRRLGWTDDMWLERVEDILYFETDPALSADRVLEFGRVLRESFYRGLPGFVDALSPVEDPEFRLLHADFFSRLALTFDQGDYARIDLIPDKPGLAEALYRRALAYHPDARAYLGLGTLEQKAGRFEPSVAILAQGLSHFPGDEQLTVCLAVSHMNLNGYREALRLLEHCRREPQAQRLAAVCRRALR